MYLAIDTQNAKIVGAPRRGFASSLSLPIEQTCPRTCALRSECYARGGKLAIHVARLENQARARGANVLTIAREASAEISDAAARGLARGRPLRLFQAGDARTESSARALATGAREWLRRGGSAAWGYTHAWRDVPRDAWRGVSMLASCETEAGARDARARGYVPARVFATLPPDGRAFDVDGTRWIPCPEQTRGRPCVDCRLCFDDRALAARGAGIAFAAHGNRSSALKRRLPMAPEVTP